MNHLLRLLIGFTFFLGIINAQAITTYQYFGNNFDSVTDDVVPGFYTTEMNITGSFTVGTSFLPMEWSYIGDNILSYSFDDGRRTLTEINSSITEAFVEIDVSGLIVAWHFEFLHFEPAADGAQIWRITTRSNGGGLDIARISQCLGLANGDCIGIANDQASVDGQPGTWTQVPIPAALWLFVAALMSLGLMKRRTA